MSTVGAPLDRRSSGFLFQKDWPYSKLLNQNVLKMKEDGIIDLLFKQNNENEMQLCTKQYVQTPRIIEHTIISFIILLVGIFTASVIVLLECIERR